MPDYPIGLSQQTISAIKAEKSKKAQDEERRLARELEKSLAHLTITVATKANGEMDEKRHRLKVLRKKLREIDEICSKMASGEVRKLEKTQEDKISKRCDYENELIALELELDE